MAVRFSDGVWHTFCLCVRSIRERKRATSRQARSLTVGSLALNPLMTSIYERVPFEAHSTVWLSSLTVVYQAEYYITATGIAVAVICVCIAVAQRHADRLWVAALVATGQLAFTLYIAQAVAILIPLQHGFLMNGSLALSIGYSLAFYLVAVAGSVWWRRRWPYGPLEGLIRQMTGRIAPGPWGGERLSSPARHAFSDP